MAEEEQREEENSPESLTVRRVQNANGHIESVVPYRAPGEQEAGFLWIDLEMGIWEQGPINALSARIRRMTFDFGRETTFMIAMPLLNRRYGLQQAPYGVIARPQEGQVLNMQAIDGYLWIRRGQGVFAGVTYREGANLDPNIQSGMPGGRSSRDLVCQELGVGPVAVEGVNALREPDDPMRPWAGPFHRIRILLTCNMNHIIGDFVTRVGRLTAFSPTVATPVLYRYRPVTNVVTEVLDREPREDERPRVPEQIWRNPFLPKVRYAPQVPRQEDE